MGMRSFRDRELPYFSSIFILFQNTGYCPMTLFGQCCCLSLTYYRILFINIKSFQYPVAAICIKDYTILPTGNSFHIIKFSRISRLSMMNASVPHSTLLLRPTKDYNSETFCKSKVLKPVENLIWPVILLSIHRLLTMQVRKLLNKL